MPYDINNSYTLGNGGYPGGYYTAPLAQQCEVQAF